MLLISLLLLVSCATNDIPNIKAYREIPFLDGPEGVYVETVTHNRGTLTPEEWAAKRPYMIMVDPEGWAEIKKSWLKACRMAGSKRCSTQLQSVADLIQVLDEIASKVIKLP